MAHQAMGNRARGDSQLPRPRTHEAPNYPELLKELLS